MGCLDDDDDDDDDNDDDGWELRCYLMGYKFAPLASETGGRQAEVTETFLWRCL